MIDWGSWFYYDETSPSCLRWKVARYKGKGYNVLAVPANAPAGTLDVSVGEGYYKVFLWRKPYKAHKVIWELHFGEIPAGFLIDHENGKSDDNRLANLRLVSVAQNSRNRRKHDLNTSGVTGVSKDAKEAGRGYWVAYWHDGGKQKRRSFSITKLGEEAAFKCACQHREATINELNKQGAGYTDRHGN